MVYYIPEFKINLQHIIDSLKDKRNHIKSSNKKGSKLIYFEIAQVEKTGNFRKYN